MFDGGIYHGGCQYYNRSDSLIKRMKEKAQKLFRLTTKIKRRTDGVKSLGYYNVEFAAYIRQKSLELRTYIWAAQPEEQRVFLRAFFDDEGNVSFDPEEKRRQVRGFQHNILTLELVQQLLGNFGITSRIDKKYNEIIVSQKENLVKFRDSINFSKGIFINPERTNSIWKRKLSKRWLLDMAIESYLPVGSPGVHRNF